VRITALYKTWKGEEFVQASLDSIYNHVDNIVFLHSDISWLGETEANTVIPIVTEYIKTCPDSKIIQIKYNSTSQAQQYAEGIRFIQQNLPSDYIMLIDTDEVWDDLNFNQAKIHLVRHIKTQTDAYLCNMYTYLKTPFLRLSNIEPCKPVVFIRGDLQNLVGVRGCHSSTTLYMPDVYMHHFTLVRGTDQQIRAKIQASNSGDYTNSVNIDTWMQEKWTKLGVAPVSDLHITAGCENFWKGITKINLSDLPPAVVRRIHELPQ
jgi:hypothetical protein